MYEIRLAPSITKSKPKSKLLTETLPKMPELRIKGSNLPGSNLIPKPESRPNYLHNILKSTILNQRSFCLDPNWTQMSFGPRQGPYLVYGLGSFATQVNRSNRPSPSPIVYITSTYNRVKVASHLHL